MQIKKSLIRKIIQGIFLLIFIYTLWVTTYPLKSNFAADFFFKIDPLAIIATSLSERVLLPGLGLCFFMIVMTLILGRFFCGWICPLGTVIDLTGGLNKKKRDRSLKEKAAKMTNFKYILLGMITLFALFGIQMIWFFDPIVIMARFVSLNFIPTFTFIFEHAFIGILKIFDKTQFLYDLYYSLKDSFLGVKIVFFKHSLVVFIFFLAVILPSLKIKRFWCRMICPLGALYAVLARVSWLKRVVREKCSACKICQQKCPMEAINPDNHYKKQECILCLDCVDKCPENITRFIFDFKNRIKNTELAKINEKGMSRRDFLISLASGISAVSVSGEIFGQRKIKPGEIVRPPAALKEQDFLVRCIRCGNCMKVCPTNGLQPIMLQTGLAGIWTPYLNADIGYCEYNCNLCGKVCPTGAIPKIKIGKKQKSKLGIAKINRKICLPWAKDKECIVCEEHCPIPQKAITIKKEFKNGKLLLRPVVDEELCTGCGICQMKCPVTPKAIKIYSERSDRT